MSNAEEKSSKASTDMLPLLISQMVRRENQAKQTTVNDQSNGKT